MFFFLELLIHTNDFGDIFVGETLLWRIFMDKKSFANANNRLVKSIFAEFPQ